jgi:hypothetical protein
MESENQIVISHENGGWDISAYVNGIKVKTAWADTGISAITKAELIQDYYRECAIILKHEYNDNAELVKCNRVLIHALQ